MKKQRRILAGTMVVAGGVLMFFAPESVGGLVLIVAGVVVEIIGIFLEHKGGGSRG
jgi:hypothetical membrane protein